MYLSGVFFLFCFFPWPLVHQNVLLRSDKLLTVGLDQKKAKEFSHHLESKTLGGGYSIPLYFSREKNLHFIPHMGLIAVFKIFQLLCHVRLC